MATTREEFVDLANELFEEFEDFQSSFYFEDATRNQQTGAKTIERHQTINGFVTDNVIKVFGKENYSTGDKLFIFKFRELEWVPETEVTRIKVNGVDHNIKEIKQASDIALFVRANPR